MRPLPLLLCLTLLLPAAGLEQEPQAPPPELRGVWLTDVDSKVLFSRKRIAEAMTFLAAHHFNVVFPVVWNQGYTLYPSAIMDSLFGIPIDPAHRGRDPLAELIEEAHRHGLKVIPWFEYGFSSSHKAQGGHLLAAKPHWAARDRAGKLLTKNGFEWMNPYHPEVQEFLAGLVLEVAARYDVDGIQGDDRLPAQPSEGGYESYTDSLYRSGHEGAAPPADHRDPEWLRWRADLLNAFACRLYRQVKAVDSTLIVSWSPSIYPFSYEEYLQDWPAWIKGGYADLVLPQVYRYDLEAYRSALLETRAVAPPEAGGRIYPGMLIKLGKYLIDPDYLLEAIRLNRELGYRGEVFFFYEGLRKQGGKLARLLLEGPYREPARPF